METATVDILLSICASKVLVTEIDSLNDSAVWELLTMVKLFYLFTSQFSENKSFHGFLGMKTDFYHDTVLGISDNVSFSTWFEMIGN